MTEANDVADWWRTKIIDMEPGRIHLRGQPVQDLIGTTGFAQMIWLMVVGEHISGPRAELFEAALVSAVDHGPQAPSIAAARMASTCGIGLQSAMATGLNMLGDVHGGAGEQAVGLYRAIEETGLAQLGSCLDTWRAAHGRFIPGFGHRFHKPVDPRTPRLFQIAAENGKSGEYIELIQKIQAVAEEKSGKMLPINATGAIGAICCEFGFPWKIVRGFGVMARAIGLVGHILEESENPISYELWQRAEQEILETSGPGAK